MITAFTTRRVSRTVLAAAVLLPVACASPFGRQPRSPTNLQPVDRVHYVSEAGQERVELQGFAGTWEPQQGAEWCWAACATMIHTWQHEPASQEDIVARIRARAPEGDGEEEEAEERLRAASEHELLLALAPDRKELLDLLWDQCATRVGEALGEQISAQTDEERAAAQQKLGEELARALVTGLAYLPTSMDLDSVMADLQDGYPVVVGLQETGDDGQTYGHACVIYGLTATYREPDGVLDGVAAMGNALLCAAAAGGGFQGESGYTYLTVKLLDPALEQPGTREMGVAELLARADFFASRPFAERVLDSEAQSLQQPASASVAGAAGPFAGGAP